MKALKTMISVLLAVILAFGCIAVAMAADTVEKEDNDTPATANDFTISSKIKGKLDDVDDIDWFKVDLGTSMGLATFKFSHPGTGTSAVYYKVSVFAEGDTAKAVSSFSVKGDAKDSSSSQVLIPGGIYLVKVESGSINVSDEYSISVSLDSNLITESESNNDKATADEISATAGYYSKTTYGTLSGSSDVDYFKFHSPTGYFSIELVALTPGVTYTVSAYMIPGDEYNKELICQYNVASTDCEPSSGNPEGFCVSADVGVKEGTYFITVSSSNAPSSGALYKIRVWTKNNDKCEEEFNYDTNYANTLTLGKTIYGTISFDKDIDMFKFAVKSDNQKYKITVKADEGNDDSASWYVSVIKSGKTLEKYNNVAVTPQKPLEIDVNGLAEGTYYIKISKCTSTKGGYVIVSEKFDSPATPEIDGNMFARIWKRIAAMDWKGFWNNNFKPLIQNIGGFAGVMKVLKDVINLSLGTIIKFRNQ